MSGVQVVAQLAGGGEMFNKGIDVLNAQQYYLLIINGVVSSKCARVSYCSVWIRSKKQVNNADGVWRV